MRLLQFINYSIKVQYAQFIQYSSIVFAVNLSLLSYQPTSVVNNYPNRTEFLQTEPNQIHSEPNPSFFQEPNRNRTEIKKSIPHIPTVKSNSVKSKSVKFLSFVGQVSSFIGCLSWLFFNVVRHDINEEIHMLLPVLAVLVKKLILITLYNVCYFHFILVFYR